MVDALSAIHDFGTSTGLDLEAVADACVATGHGYVVDGLGPLWEGSPSFAGRAVTMELVCDGYPVEQNYHLGVDAILGSDEGSVIVIDHRGRRDVAGWGGLLTRAAMRRGVRGVVIDGAARDVDEARELGLPIVGAAAVARTARGRVVQRSHSRPIDLRGAPVCPGDLVFAGTGGAVIVPYEVATEILDLAGSLAAGEREMAVQLDADHALEEVFGARYEQALHEEDPA